MDIQLHFTKTGSGFPLILLHGNGEDSSYFEHQIPVFSRTHTVYAVDTRGHGKSPMGTAPFGIRVMFSRDNGESWSASEDIYENDFSLDLGYPSTVELKDGSLLTVFYAHLEPDDPAVILQQKWRIENDEI